MACEPRRPTSSAAYHWISTVRSGTKPPLMMVRKTSRMVVEPEPSSSAPGARPLAGLRPLMLSWWAPRMTVSWLREPGMRAMTDGCAHECANCSTVTPVRLAAIADAVSKIQRDDSTPVVDW